MEKNLSTVLKFVKILLVLAGLAISSTAMAQEYNGNTLVGSSNQFLKRHHALRSTNGVYSLLVQDDGNLALYKDGGNFQWGTMTQGKDGALLTMQADGNLVLKDGGGNHIWSTDTYRGGPDKTGSKLVMQNDGQLVLLNAAGTPIWSHTKGRLY